MTAATSRQTVAAYREIVKRLTADVTGICVDDDCPACDHPELSAPLNKAWEPMDVIMRRKCGWARVTPGAGDSDD